MKVWKIISPGLFGLLIYFTIRIINDTVAEFRFWERHWSINAIEIVSCVGTGYLMLWIFRKLFHYFDSRSQGSFTFKTITKEILWVSLICELIMSITITPMAALTDDGLSWGDAATIYLIPLMFCIIFYTITRSKKLLQVYVENKIQLERIQNEQLNTELKFLKAQYHPHFLFNALNTIYFKMDENVVDAKKLVEKFSDLLRYQLYDQQQQVTVRNELDYLEAYIDLQKERMSDSSQLQVDFDQRLNGEKIYPLLLLPLVENAFKYAGGDNCINISAKLELEELVFEVSNSTGNIKTNTQVGGIGLENLKRRLELLYPGMYKLDLSDKENNFYARLRLKTRHDN